MNQSTMNSPEDVQVRAQLTPNPFALKFITNQTLINDGKASFTSAAECAHLPLVESLFFLGGIKQVHLFQNTLTVSHTGQMDDEELTSQVEAVVRTRMALHNPEFAHSQVGSGVSPKKDRSDLSPELQQIEEILDRTIRPGLQADGGDIDVLELSDNVLKIVYQGACGGCPSAMMGTLEAIQGILQQETENPDLRVVPI